MQVSQMLTLAGVVALDPYSKRDYGNYRRKSSANVSWSYHLLFICWVYRKVQFFKQ